jgi:cyclin L
MRKKLIQKPLDLGGERYNQWKGELITMEMYLLKELGFSFYHILDHPHKYILYFIKFLEGDKQLAQVAWNYLNDSCRLDVALRYPAVEIACAAIFMAARKENIALPDNPPWWKIMMNDKGRLLDICDAILGLYELPKVR